VPYSSVVDVLLILTRGDHVLLAQREGTGYADGMWNLPSGKLEDGEHALAALIRETREEIGINLRPDELRHTGVVHCRNPEQDARLGLFFAAPSHPESQGEPFNAEPHKCAQLAWFPLELLPADTVPYTAVGLDLYRTGQPFTTLGWEPTPSPRWSPAPTP
jgi:8-oxo-dGTP pyrophosphatase MutT (NUDIX family)